MGGLGWILVLASWVDLGEEKWTRVLSVSGTASPYTYSWIHPCLYMHVDCLTYKGVLEQRICSSAGLSVVM